VRAELPSLARGDDDPERFKALEAEIHDMLFARTVEETHAD
jgi:NitT/TauT family transport system ATP-binding protein